MQNCHDRIEELMSVRIYVFGFVAVVVAAIMVRRTRQTLLGVFFLCFFKLQQKVNSSAMSKYEVSFLTLHV